MPRTDPRPPCSWLTGLILIMVLAMASQVWSQSSGMGRSGGMGGLMGRGMGGPMDGEGGPGPGGGRGWQAPLRFDLTKATTITGQVASLGSYRLASASLAWHGDPGINAQDHPRQYRGLFRAAVVCDRTKIFAADRRYLGGKWL